MDMCWPKFYIYQGTLTPNCIKSHANSYVLILKSFVLCLVWNTILWESLETNFQAVPTGCILLCFPMLWDIDGKPRVFSMWCSIPWDKNLMEKKHPHFGKSMGTNFLGSSHKMGFVFFSSGIGYWWEDLCIFHMMKHTVG